MSDQNDDHDEDDAEQAQQDEQATEQGNGTPLGGRFQMDKLLDALIKYNGSDLHLRVNRPPCIRVRGELRNLGTTLLTPDDTTSLMKSITAERNQTELGEKGGS